MTYDAGYTLMQAQAALQNEAKSSVALCVKDSIRMIVAAVFLVTGAMDVMAIEEAAYTVLESDNNFEIREYAPHILAETIVDGDLEEAGNKAFKRLFGYISGDNRAREKVAMTTPVSQVPKGEKIKMTAPVGQRRARESWVVSFMMPATYTLETLPQPDDPAVMLRQVDAQRMAAVRYSGFWSEKAYLRNKQKLESWIREKGLTMTGDPVWARYNSPFSLWFLRRNEILIPVEAGTDQEVTP